MEQFYKIQISKQKIGDRDRLIYPEVLGQDFVSLGYNADCSEAVLKVDLPEQQENAVKADQRITLLTQTEAKKLVESYHPATAETQLRSDVERTSTARIAMLRALSAAPDVLENDLLEGQAVFPQEDWKAPERKRNGWVNYSRAYNPVGFFKDSLGIVHLRGVIKNGAFARENGDTNKPYKEERGIIFELPVFYRPEYRQLFIAMTYRDTFGRVDVTTQGRVIAVVGDSHWISLDGITFRAVDRS